VVSIKGVEWTSLVDFPGQICTTLFWDRCNMRCRFCHNAPLVLMSPELSAINEALLLTKLQQRKELVPAVCISGGEPTLDPELPVFIKRLKNLGFAVKLDTNGTQPDMLRELLAGNLIDYVAMDIKGPADKYNLIVNVPVDIKMIQDSIGLVRKMAPAYEFRTTVVPGLLEESDIMAIGCELAGVQKYVLQQFKPSIRLLDRQLEKRKPYPDEFLYQVAAKLEAYVATVEVRC
jgi:pyruvate formate lyase activating enzyme